MAIQADDVLAGHRAQPGERGADAAPARPGARARRAQRRAPPDARVGHGLAVALATLGQIFVQLGDLERAEQILTRTLEVRSPIQFHETTGAVFDTLAQIHLMRGSYERAGEYLRLASEAYGAYGTQTMRWYEWSLKVLGVKLAIRRGAYDEALAHGRRAGAARPACRRPKPFRRTWRPAKRWSPAAGSPRRSSGSSRARALLDPRTAPATWGEFLRIRGAVHERSNRPAAAYHDFAQSANVFELLGERYQAALSQLALGRLAARAATAPSAERYLDQAGAVFSALGRERDLDGGRARPDASCSEAPPTPAAVLPGRRRRCRRAAAGRCGDPARAAGARDGDRAPRSTGRRCRGRVRRRRREARSRVAACAGCDADVARALARAAAQGKPRVRRRPAADRVARPRPRRSRAPARSSRPSGSRSAGAPVPDVRRGRPAGLRAVRRARAPAAARSSQSTSGRSSRCCPASSAPARR